MSSAHFPQSNSSAEVAVKSAKRLLMSNTGPTGNLDHDRFVHAILQLRNTPDRDCHISPAQIIFGRPLRDTLSFVNRLEKFSNPHIPPVWRQAWAAKEDALRSRITRTTESLREHSRPPRPLAPGETVFLQNQQCASATKWDRSGFVVESLDHDQYRVKKDYSGRLTIRNRRFLRAYTPATPSIELQPATLPPALETVRTTSQLASPPQRLAENSSHPSMPLPDCQEIPPPAVAPQGVPKAYPPLPTPEGPTPVVDTPSDHESSGAPTPSAVPLQKPPVPQTSVPQSLSPPPPAPRPSRERRSLKRFEPETGWIDR